MEGQHFTLTISQSTTDPCDFAIHMKEEGESEKMLVHLRFSDLPMLNEKYLDNIVGVLAKKLAKRMIEWRVAPDYGKTPMADQQDEAKAVVDAVLEKMKKSE